GAAGPYIPPADFLALVEMFSTQALVALGMISHPSTGKPQPQLQLARHFIDLLAVVEAKTKGNLSAEESSLLDSTLHFLRMTFVEVTRKPADSQESRNPSGPEMPKSE